MEEDKEKLKDLFKDTIKYFYPKDRFTSDDPPEIPDTPTERALDHLEYIISNMDCDFSDEEIAEIQNKDLFYKLHKIKIDKINSLIYAKIMKEKELKKEETKENQNNRIENENIKRNKTKGYVQLVGYTIKRESIKSENINDYFLKESTLEKGDYESIEQILKNLINFSQIENKLKNKFLSEEEVINLLNFSQIFRENTNLFLKINFLLLSQLQGDSFNKISNLEEIFDFLEIYLFNNQLSSDLLIYVLKVFKKIPFNNFKLAYKMINFIELLLKNVYSTDHNYKLECFNILLLIKDKKSIFNFLLNEYEILEKKEISGIELRIILLSKLFESYIIIDDSFNETNFIIFTNKVFSFVSFEKMIKNISHCPTSRMIVFTELVYQINTNFSQKFAFFHKLSFIESLFLEINAILHKLTNENAILINASVKEEVLYKFILKKNNLTESLFFIFKQLSFHLLSNSNKLLRILFKSYPSNLLLNKKEKKSFINALKNKFINLGSNLQLQLIDYLEGMNYKDTFIVLSLIHNKKAFLKMIKYIHKKECINIIMSQYINIIKEGKEVINIINNNELFDLFSKLFYYEINKSFISNIKIPIYYLDRIITLENAILIKHYSFYNPNEFISHQSTIFNLLRNNNILIKKYSEYYNCILSILLNILTDDIIIDKLILFCMEYIYYEEYFRNIILILKKYLIKEIPLGTEPYHQLIQVSLYNKECIINDTILHNKSIIYKCYNDITLINQLLPLLNESVSYDLLQLILYYLKNNTSEEVFTFVSHNQNYFLNLKSNDKKISYLNYKIVYYAYYYGAILYEVSFCFLIYYAYKLNIKVNLRMDDICYNELYYYSSEDENIFYNIISSTDTNKRRLLIINNIIKLIDPLEIKKSVIIIKSLGKIKLTTAERKLIIKKIKEIILLSGNSDKEILFIYYIYKVMLLIKRKKLFDYLEEEGLLNECGEDRLNEIRKIVEMIEL